MEPRHNELPTACQCKFFVDNVDKGCNANVPYRIAECELSWVQLKAVANICINDCLSTFAKRALTALRDDVFGIPINKW